MKNLDGDKKLEYLKEKILNGEKLTGEDILTLTFLPLMSTKRNKGNITIESIELAEKIPEGNEKLQCLTLLCRYLISNFFSYTFEEVSSTY